MTDEFAPAYSTLVVATKSRTRFWDGDAVRSPGTSYDRTPGPNGTGAKSEAYAATGQTRGRLTEPHNLVTNPAGAPLLDYWVIPTAPYKGSHYATYPPDLVVPLVKSMCPARVCRVCGKPSERITAPTEEYAAFRGMQNESYSRGDNTRLGAREASGSPGAFDSGGEGARGIQHYTTLGWSDCGHNDWRAGHVLDPFGGSGTTAAVATGHGFDCTLIDLDERNADLARERVGMFLDIEYGAASAVRPIVETEAL